MGKRHVFKSRTLCECSFVLCSIKLNAHWFPPFISSNGADFQWHVLVAKIPDQVSKWGKKEEIAIVELHHQKFEQMFFTASPLYGDEK